MACSIRNIKEILHDKIVIHNNDNIEQEIDLLECSKNWVEHFNNEGNYITWEDNPAPKISVENNKCVGKRDWFAETPYFEFFSGEKISFEIRPKNDVMIVVIKIGDIDTIRIFTKYLWI